MVDAIWSYEKNVQNGERYPECPYWSYYVEIIDLDFTDKNRINEVVADMEKMGADSILVLPDYRHHNGFDNPHIAVSFPHEKQT